MYPNPKFYITWVGCDLIYVLENYGDGNEQKNLPHLVFSCKTFLLNSRNDMCLSYKRVVDNRVCRETNAGVGGHMVPYSGSLVHFKTRDGNDTKTGYQHNKFRIKKMYNEFIVFLKSTLRRRFWDLECIRVLLYYQ